MAKKRFSLQQQLRFDELFLQNVLDAIQDGISVLDSEFNILHTNKIMEKMYQEHMPLVGKKCYKVYQERKSLCPWCPSIKCLKEGKKFMEQVPLGSEKAPRGWLELTSYPMFDKNGDIIGVIENVKDITAWKNTQAELDKERDLFSEGPVLTIVWSPEKNWPVTYVSQNIVDVLGYNKDEWLSEDFTYADIIHPDDLDRITKEVKSNIRNQVDTYSQEYRVRKKNGSYIDIYDFTKLDRNEKGKLVAIRGYIFDQTERKAAGAIAETLYKISDALNKSDDLDVLYDKIREYLGKIIDTSNFFIGLYDEDNDLLSIPYDIDEKNEFKELIYYNEQEDKVTAIPMKKTVTAHVIRTGEPLLATKKQIEDMQRSGIVEGLGTLPEIWLGVPLKTQDKIIGAIVVQNYHDPNTYTEHEKDILSNVSNQIALMIQKKNIDDALRASEEKYRKLIKNSNDILVIIDENAKELYVSESVERIIGYSPEAFLGTSGFDHIHKDDVEPMREKLNQLLKYPDKKVRNVYRHRHKDGHWVYLEAIGTNYLNDPKIKGIVLNIRDITERRKADEALRESEEKYRTIVSSMSDIILLHDKNNRYVEFHCKPDSSLLLNPDEFIGKTVREIMPESITNEFEILAEKVRQTGEKEEMEYSLKIQGKKMWFSGTLYLYSDGESIVFDVRDVTKRKKAEQVQLAMYNISHAVNTVENMHELYMKIREYLGSVIDTTNFYVVLYDKKSDTISLPFEVDEKDTFETFPAGKTLTAYVIKTGKPLFASKDVQNKLVKEGLIEIIGSPAHLWLGAPLKSDGNVIGAIVVQSYDDPELYSEEDIDILTFISEEIVLAIQHAQSHEQLQRDLKEKKVLLREIQHRVKNNLQTISGLLQLQQYKIETKEDAIKGFEVSQDRILAMAKAYEILLESEYLSDVGIGKYIKSLAGQLKRNYDIYNKIDIEYFLDEVIIDTERLGKIGLIINEIITNSMKYAFKEREEGKIQIQLKDLDKDIKISISDNGVGIPKDIEFPNPDTLGMSLIEMLIKELEGEISLVKEAGTTYSMIIPKEKKW
ncbi:MAG: PAS domain S-box protein [Candidatus Cloacimonetes bacterium]|nr:PAS domain S-box protein [Candidatus Cloacimonadota bacterium]